MARKNTNTYWILLLILVLAGSIVLTVGQTQARYSSGDTTIVNTVVLADAGAVKSNCLIADARQIILLGGLNPGESVTAKFTLEAVEDLSDLLSWYVSDGSLVGVNVEFQMTEGAGSLTEHSLEMEKGAKAEVTMTLTGISGVADNTTVDVQVLCENLLGTFRVVLLAGELEEPTEESTDPSQTEGETTESTAGEGETTEASESTAGEGETTEATEATTASGESTEATTEPEPSTEASAAPVEDATDPTTGGEESNPTDPTDSGADAAAASAEAEQDFSITTAYIDAAQPLTLRTTVLTETTETEETIDETEPSTEAPTDAPTEPTETTEAPTDPTEGTTEDPTGESTEDPTEDPTEEFTEDPTEESTEDPTEESTEDPTEESTEDPTEESTEDPTEESTEDPTEESTEDPTEESTEDPTEESTEDPTEESTEDPTEETEATAEIMLKTLTEFEVTSQLPVKIHVSGAVDQLTLGMNGMGAFPAFTRYSLDGGATYYLLYYGGYIEVDSDFAGMEPGDVAYRSLVIDFSAANLTAGSTYTLAAWASLEGEVTGTGFVDTTPIAGEIQLEEVRILTKPQATEAAVALAELGEETQTETLDGNSSFVITFPAGWNECQLEYEVAIMRAGETGVEYEAVELNQKSLYAELDYLAQTLTVRLGEELPPAGTYRLTIRSSYEGICFEQKQMTFFINYSTSSDAQSKEVPDND